jgi:hypothetical protein
MGNWLFKKTAIEQHKPTMAFQNHQVTMKAKVIEGGSLQVGYLRLPGTKAMQMSPMQGPPFKNRK